ncbi:LysR family transcriptional regulator [Kibdelosporangium aridum]|uniref:LysR family transcriptional regulator n=1 Tax=Kibdelosporangium aridum TaxID=2030 RepID=UPI0035E994F4
MADPTLRQLEFLVAVADSGGMTAAATRCHVSQSTVSLAIAELERVLEVRLVIRGSGRRSDLTDAGRQVAAEARAVLAAVADLGATARGLGGDLAGTLGVGCYAPLAALHLPSLIAGFRERHPEVHVEYVEGTLLELQRGLQQGTCELALLYRQDLLPGIAAEVLYDRQPSVLLPANHRLAGNRTVPMRELAQEPFILLDVARSARYFAAVFEALGLTMTVAHRASSFDLTRALVARGLGWSLSVQRQPLELSVEGLPLAIRPVREEVPTTPVVLAHAEGGRLTRRAEAFAAFCRELFGSGDAQ